MQKSSFRHSATLIFMKTSGFTSTVSGPAGCLCINIDINMIYIYIFIYLFIYLFVYIFIYLSICLLLLFEGSLETKVPTIWTDEKQHSQEEAEPGRNSDV